MPRFCPTYTYETIRTHPDDDTQRLDPTLLFLDDPQTVQVRRASGPFGLVVWVGEYLETFAYIYYRVFGR